uniref:3-methyl-2-oxobutanoate hydroxymethyltransferase n=1 Tax=Meloidogyne javanica TaxID=6303 RepID=A0A915LGM1_MELJA
MGDFNCGYQVQGNSKSKRTAEELLELAIQVEKCGASAVVLECVTKDLVKQITDSLKIPTIGIGAEDACEYCEQIRIAND